MAKPIKETPTLKGRDSSKFLEAVKANENNSVPKEKFIKSKEAYLKLLSNAKL